MRYWEKYIGGNCFYFGFRSPINFKLGVGLSFDEVDVNLLFVTFGWWK